MSTDYSRLDEAIAVVTMLEDSSLSRDLFYSEVIHIFTDLDYAAEMAMGLIELSHQLLEEIHQNEGTGPIEKLQALAAAYRADEQKRD
ncbi:hypothetical protein LWF01_00255 [Saxibacter everestensis]|uniref:MafI family immunity protein n=1 Tax=Saxibacter everestensis TaxID=2909229 RepID=A0ABY8QTD4_9MICO|nr:hypothetical protein LWF01_00255 [Brevibacteriaceae bacterium ZFBP1038]